MNSTMIDIVFIAFFIIFALIGYFKGFITRLYDLTSTIIVIFLSYTFAKPVSSIFVFYHYNQDDMIASVVGKIINQMIIFFILLIVLSILKLIIGVILKPVLKRIVEIFSLTKLADRILGVGLSIIEAFVLSYIFVLLLITPIYLQGNQLLDNTYVAKNILNVIPSLTTQIQDLSEEFNMESTSQYSTETILKTMLIAEKLGILDQQQTLDILNDNVFNKLNYEDITVSKEQIKQIEDILEKNGYNKEEIISKINVSDE